MTSNPDNQRPSTLPVGRSGRVPRGNTQAVVEGTSARRVEPTYDIPSHIARYPERLSREAFHAAAYPLMLLSRRLEERLLELFRKGYVKGTVTISAGNEATTVGMAMPFRPGRDILSLLHRDFGSHLLQGAKPYDLVCQYMANADSPTHGREGNVHHGDAAARRFPMISHLGSMLSLVVGGTWAARRNGEDAFGLAVIGDGGTSTGAFHESLNMASVRRAPVLFLIENNHYAFSTPTSAQYTCDRLSDRAAGYGIEGRTIDGTDAWEVYSAVWDAMDAMHDEPVPKLIECMSLRLHGHAAYDKGEYVDDARREEWRRRDPLIGARRDFQEYCGVSDAKTGQVEERVEEEIQSTVAKALEAARPNPKTQYWSVYADSSPAPIKPFGARQAKNGSAVNLALKHILENSPRAFCAGMDIGAYGSAFKTTKGLIDKFGPERIIDMPLCESAITGFALGASQTGAEPIVEFQFADFSTEAVTELGLNAGTWYFRTARAAPMLLRLPCGGGLALGAFHSGEFEGLWSRFPGLKILYPTTPQEVFESLVAGFYDRNPCLVMEHKLLYWSTSGPIEFDGDLESVWRPRRHTEGTDLTVVGFGAMVHEAVDAAARIDASVEIWNPLVLQPMDLGPIVQSVEKTGRLLVVQECGETQGLGDRVISQVLQRCQASLRCRPMLVAAPDVPIPFATELESYCRPSAEKIRTRMEQMLGES